MITRLNIGPQASVAAANVGDRAAMNSTGAEANGAIETLSLDTTIPGAVPRGFDAFLRQRERQIGDGSHNRPTARPQSVTSGQGPRHQGERRGPSCERCSAEGVTVWWAAPSLRNLSVTITLGADRVFFSGFRQKRLIAASSRRFCSRTSSQRVHPDQTVIIHRRRSHST